jgi:hypothetical protein
MGQDVSAAGELFLQSSRELVLRTYPDAAESIPSPRTESNLFISEFPNKMLNEIVIPLHVGTVSSDHVNNYSYTIILVYDAT